MMMTPDGWNVTDTKLITTYPAQQILRCRIEMS